MTLSWSRFTDRSFARATDFTRRREARFGETLFLREVVVFNEGFVVVGC